MKFQDFSKNFNHSDIYALLFQHESLNGFLNFCKNNMFWKNPVLELWSRNLHFNQNAGFFKQEYLKTKLRYEVEFLFVTRGP